MIAVYRVYVCYVCISHNYVIVVWRPTALFYTARTSSTYGCLYEYGDDISTSRDGRTERRGLVGECISYLVCDHVYVNKLVLVFEKSAAAAATAGRGRHRVRLSAGKSRLRHLPWLYLASALFRPINARLSRYVELRVCQV